VENENRSTSSFQPINGFFTKINDMKEKGMYNKKSNFWAGFSLFMLLALVMAGCSGSPVAAAQPTTVAQAPTTASTAMPATAMPTSITTAMSTEMPTAMSTTLPAAPSGTQPAAGTMPTAAAFTLMVGTNGTLGNYLTDQDGRSLYIFANDTATTSNCNGACATLWPPLVGSAAAGSGVTGSMIGTITRQDGSSQVSYGGHPLYYFSQDVNPVDLKGQGYGNGVWWVIAPTGAPINMMLSGTPAAPAAPASMMTATP
jgi:predicted lipoprotein with Yx(FWY)xxD motif